MAHSTVALALALGLTIPATALAEEKVKGFAEWRRGDVIVVEGQLVRADASTQFKGRGITGLGSIPLGYEVEAEGDLQADGAILAREIEAKPNGDAMFEGDVLQATNEIEAVWVGQGRMFEPGEDGDDTTIGRLADSVPRADRVRAIMRRLVPPYVDYDEQVRVHVVATEEWNAAAMGNGAIWVYTGLIDSMSDDELAVVLGHELAHYTHEHSRRQAKTGMWQGLVGLAAVLASEAIDSDVGSGIATVAAGIGLTVWGSGYSRGLEDQADRVGLRYAYEGGYNVGAGVPLWSKFRERYGESDKVTNFFFGSHSRPSDRISNIRDEIARNYRDMPEYVAMPVPESGSSAVSDAGDSSEWVRQVEEQLESARRELGDQYKPIYEPVIDEVDADGSMSFDLAVDRGVDYLVVGVCDNDCDDVDLLVYDEADEEVVSGFEPDDYPVLAFSARTAGSWSVEVRMPGCSADTCIFGFQVFER
ncbi:MAG TPA: M48 family metalloprotease [Acidobacteriota bacterium]|nr:M48 family metalloprotease [Acidobacteriota bacterium]